MKAYFRKATVVGHGGMSCPCCAPKSGNKYGAAARTVIKRQAKRWLSRLVTQLNKGEYCLKLNMVARVRRAAG